MATPLTDPELLAFSNEHLMHELTMLWELGEILPDRAKSTETSALIESFATHLRNLIEFFFFGKDEKYVRANDFFDQPASWSPALTTDMKKLLSRANNEVSHLTRNRKDGSPDEKKWKTGEMVKQIEGVASTFAAQASHKKLDAAVRDFLKVPNNEKRIWIGENVTRSNVAAYSVSVTSNP
jgi:hypothetical protein